uniref:Uncharacterized protein n=1 Tax=Panagrolaimus superbus TaxID=310955 RepID=A0A914Y0M8_9BILA
MNEYEREKTRFIQKLNQANSWMYGYFFEFFEGVFDYLRLRNLLKIESFCDEESNALNKCLNKLISIFSKYFEHYLTQLKPQHCYKTLKIRSVMEFLKIDCANFTSEISKETLISLTEYDSDLWNKVNNFSSSDRFMSGWDIGDVPIIDGIPESHYWWTEFHRKGKANPYNFNFENYVKTVFPDYKKHVLDQINQIFEYYLKDSTIKIFVCNVIMKSNEYSNLKFLSLCQQIHKLEQFFKEIHNTNSEISFTDSNEIIINNTIKLHPFVLNEMGTMVHPRTDLNRRVLLYEMTKHRFQNMLPANEIAIFKSDRIIFQGHCQYIREMMENIYGTPLDNKIFGNLSTIQYYRIKQVFGLDILRNIKPLWITGKKMMCLFVSPADRSVDQLCNYVEVIGQIRLEKTIKQMVKNFIDINPGTTRYEALHDDEIFNQMKIIFEMYKSEVEEIGLNGFASISGATYHSLKHAIPFMLQHDEEEGRLVPYAAIKNYLEGEIPFKNFDASRINQNGTAFSLAFKKNIERLGGDFVGFGKILIDPDGPIPIPCNAGTMKKIEEGKIEFNKVSKYRLEKRCF